MEFSAFAANAQILPSGRSIVWTNTVGVPGGVPNVTTIFTNMTCDNTGATDVSGAINHALAICPTGQVVLLPAGTFLISNTISIQNGTVLRGAGMGQTIVDSHTSGSFVIQFYPASTPPGPSADGAGNYSTAITSFAGFGTNSFTVADAAHIPYGVGSFLQISETNDVIYDSNKLVSIVGNEGTATWVDGGLGWNGTRALGQIVQVTNITGNVIGFTPPLYVTYSNSLAPLATDFSISCQNAGVENLTVKSNNTGGGSNFGMTGAAFCWLKNVEGDFTDGDHADLYFCYRCEVRDSYFHDAWTHSPGSYDADVDVADKSTACLVENNIMWRLHVSVILEWGAAGNVIAYNFSTNDFDSSGYNTVLGDFCGNHGAHPMFNLFEGNVGASFHPDSIWGSSSDGTAFRNNFYGMGYAQQPLTGNGPVQFTNCWIVYQAMRTVQLDFASRNYNLLGNVLGDEWMRTNSTVPGNYISIAPGTRAYDTGSDIYSLGYGGLSDGGTYNSYTNDNSIPYSSAIIEGNYDYVTQTTVWTNAGSYYNTGMTPVVLPNSLYLSAQPSWWSNSVPFPPIGPDVSGFNNPIPAELRFAMILAGINASGGASQTTKLGNKTMSPPTKLQAQSATVR